MNLDPVVLTGAKIRLEPLLHRHADDLLTAAAHDKIWTYLDEPTPRDMSRMTQLIDDALQDQAQGMRLPFAIIVDGVAVGSISFLDIRPTDRAAEIGWAWLAPEQWRRGVTSEAMYLLLHHAFEELGAVRIAMKADTRNTASQRMMLSVGAVHEGVFRKHRILSDGYQRNSAYFSVIDTDWPDVRQRLASRFGPAAQARSTAGTTGFDS